MADGQYTFYPKFSEMVTLYRGVVQVWIGDGETGDQGVLYAEYIDGQVQRIGPVSSYADAVQNGYEGTLEEWINHILEVTDRAMDAEAWANGTRLGVPVSSDDEAYHKNGAYFANLTAADRTATNTAKNDANTAKTAAQAAQTAAETAASNALSAEGFAEAAQAAAETAEAAAQLAQHDTEQAQAAAETARDAALGYRNEASAYATSAYGHSEQAALSEDGAMSSALDSEAYAIGERDGTAVGSGDVAYHNNSKYYSQLAGASETAASGYASDAQHSSDTSEGWAQTAESWAEGTANGTPVQQYATNNAKYYSQQASASATNASNSASDASTSAGTATTKAGEASSSASSAASARDAAEGFKNNASTYATNASNSATAAAGSATTASGYKETAEAYAIGTRNETPVGSSDPAYHNNAKYYAQYADDKVAEFNSVTQSAVTTYQNSNSGTVVPSGTWNANPNPTAGSYMWLKTTFTWGTGSTSDIYNVTYIGVNGTGSVDSVNGLGGNVTLDAQNIYLDATAASPETISQKFADIVTNNQIDALFT